MGDEHPIKRVFGAPQEHGQRKYQTAAQLECHNYNNHIRILEVFYQSYYTSFLFLIQKLYTPHLIHYLVLPSYMMIV